MTTIKIDVDIQRLKEIASSEEYYAIFGLADSRIRIDEAYVLILNFIVDDSGKKLEPSEARKYLKGKVTQVQMENEVIPEFLRQCRYALVNPTNGGG